MAEQKLMQHYKLVMNIGPLQMTGHGFTSATAANVSVVWRFLHIIARFKVVLLRLKL